MLESLLELTLSKKQELKEKLDELYANGPDTSKKWVNHSFTENNRDITLAAGDGSINKKKFLSFIFYAISAETIIYRKKLQKIESSTVDLLPHHRFVDDRLRNYMGLYELKNALKSLEEESIDYYLFDGSILGNLIRPIPLDKELSGKTKDKIKSRYLSALESELDSLEVSIKSSEFEEDLSKHFDNKTEAMIYLENLENLLVISKLLKNGSKVVAISKTSTNNEYFGLDIPDMALFDRNHPKQGYSKPKFPKVSTKVKHDFPVKNEFFRGITFTMFYARLEDNGNLLKFELPYKIGDEEKIEEKIVNLLNTIKSNCVEGYPYLLKKAHHDVIIKNRDMERLLKIMGFLEKDGREML